jgi:hypothetical protein
MVEEIHDVLANGILNYRCMWARGIVDATDLCVLDRRARGTERQNGKRNES